MRYHVRSLIIVLATTTLLLAVGIVRLRQKSGAGRVLRDVKQLVPQIEQRDQQIDEVAVHKMRATEAYIEQQHRNSAGKQLDLSYPIYYPPSDK